MPTHVQLVRENNLVLRSSHPGQIYIVYKLYEKNHKTNYSVKQQ